MGKGLISCHTNRIAGDKGIQLLSRNILQTHEILYECLTQSRLSPKGNDQELAQSRSKLSNVSRQFILEYQPEIYSNVYADTYSKELIKS